jgi:hypothetical protein
MVLLPRILHSDGVPDLWFDPSQFEPPISMGTPHLASPVEAGHFQPPEPIKINLDGDSTPELVNLEGAWFIDRDGNGDYETPVILANWRVDATTDIWVYDGITSPDSQFAYTLDPSGNWTETTVAVEPLTLFSESDIRAEVLAHPQQFQVEGRTLNLAGGQVADNQLKLIQQHYNVDAHQWESGWDATRVAREAYLAAIGQSVPPEEQGPIQLRTDATGGVIGTLQGEMKQAELPKPDIDIGRHAYQAYDLLQHERLPYVSDNIAVPTLLPGDTFAHVWTDVYHLPDYRFAEWKLTNFDLEVLKRIIEEENKKP